MPTNTKKLSADPRPNKRKSTAVSTAQRARRGSPTAKAKPTKPKPKAASDVEKRTALKREAAKMRKVLDNIDKLLS